MAEPGEDHQKVHLFFWLYKYGGLTSKKKKKNPLFKLHSLITAIFNFPMFYSY